MMTMIDVRADVGGRLERVQAALRTQQLDALAVYFGGQHNMLRMDQLMYLTDFRALDRGVLVVPATGRPHLIVAPAWDAERARATAAEFDLTAVAADRVIDEAAAVLRGFSGRVALAGRSIMPIAAYEAFAAAFGRDLADGEGIIPTIGATRTPAEIERVERAAAIADEGFRVMCETARVGMREYELAAEVEAAMHALGAEDNFGLIGAGKHNLAVRPPTDRRLEEGDVVVGEITPCYRGYMAQLCRTFVLGTPTDAQRRTYDMLLDALEKGYAAARPGQPSADIARAINGVISDGGFGEYCKPPYMRTRGHGLGLGGVVPYDITDSLGPTLEEHMVMVIHPNQYIPETGYMMCGDTVVIEHDGPRPLTKTAQRLFWKAV
jgi:Xaa-Pro aminopeptidase